MGSLVGGWDSPVHHSKHLTRNNSLTMGEIDAYWRNSKKKKADIIIDQKDDQHHESYRYDYEDAVGTKHRHLIKSNSMPTPNTVTVTDKEAAAGEEEDTPKISSWDWEELIDNKAKGWWRRSNLAFLNEPPVFEGTTRGYSSQFNVANFQHPNSSTAVDP